LSNAANPSGQNISLSQVVVGLMKGVTYRDENARAWQALLGFEAQVREYTSVIGLELVLDEPEGYAFLRQRTAAEGEEEPPRLVPRRQLGFSVSLLLVLLRRKLAEFDASSGETRLILRKEEIVNLLSVFLPGTANEARQMDRVETDIRKIVEMGFLRRLGVAEDEFEVRRILKAFVDAQWLSDFNVRLAEYRALLDGATALPGTDAS
jgi:hypothetical protein